MVACVRDMEGDPAAIRDLFGMVDRMAVRELIEAHVHFYQGDRGFTPIDDFVLQRNFHDGREDSSPLRVSDIRRLQFSGSPRNNVSYLVSTRRSQWFDRGSALNSGYTEISELWLVHFSNCRIDTIREAPELNYLFEDAAAGGN